MSVAPETDGPAVGMAMIVRDEAATIERCLASFWDHVDHVSVVDTGSEDDTVAVVERFAAERGESDKLTLGRFAWVDDFAAARTAADAALPDWVAWRSWIDADDVLVGGQSLRDLAAQAPPELAAYVCGYRYATDASGNCVCYLRRERLVRAGRGRWEGRVHEAQALDGTAATVPPETCEWVHQKPPDAGEPGRNLRILEAWVEDEPENPRVLGYLGSEELARGRHAEAAAWFGRYLALDPGWDEERAQVHRKTALAKAALGDEDGATAAALEAMMLLPTWPDTYLTLAECAYRTGALAKAVHWSDEVLRLGPPDTLLIVNPLDYSVSPLVVKAASLAQLGDLAQAVALGETVLATVPDHPLGEAWQGWRGQLKLRSTADTFVSCAQLLCAHDEQLKARAVLDSVPHYAVDDPQVVAWRSMLRERLDPLLDPEGYADHYEDASRPEDMVGDDRVMALGDALPRCAFLLRGLERQAAA